MEELDRIEEMIRHSKQRVFTRAELFRMIEQIKGWKSKHMKIDSVVNDFHAKPIDQLKDGNEI
jgi:hypothetical protein